MGKDEDIDFDIEERLLEYSVKIIKIVEQLPNTKWFDTQKEKLGDEIRS